MTATGGFPAPGPQDREHGPELSYGAPPAAGPTGPPQNPMLTAYKPGIVPLRPLQLGDILDGAFKAVRFNPKSMVGLSALVLAAFLIPSAALGIGVTRLFAHSISSLDPELRAGPSEVTGLLFSGLATALLSGLLIHVVGQAVLGRKPDFGETWRATRGRVPSLLALTFLSTLFAFLSAAVLIGPGAWLLVNGERLGNDERLATGLILLFLGLLGFIAVTLAVSTKIAFAGPAIVLEGHGLLAGLRRSFTLTKGSAFWRVLGITLLAAVIAGIAAAVLGLPFSVVEGLIPDQGSETGQIAVTFVTHLSTLLTGAITTPFLAAVTGLLYIDRRMRLEALDVVLLREAQSNPAPRI